jgi:hypothetical protein
LDPSSGPQPCRSVFCLQPTHPRPEEIIRTAFRHLGLFLFTIPFVLLAWATDSAAQEEGSSSPWDVSAELSYTDQAGNKVLRLLTGGLNVSHLEKTSYRLDGTLQSRYGQSDGEVVARNHYASLAFDLHPEDTWAPFLFADAERDEFKRLDLRFSGGAGAKYTFYRPDVEADGASASLALLYSYENLSRAEDPASLPEIGREPLSTHRARWSFRVKGSQEVGPGVTLNHTTFYQPIWDQVANYLLRSETGAKVLMSERLALSVEYQMNRTSRPPEGVEPDDRLFKTGLIINF